MSIIERDAKLFEAANYADKGMDVTESDLDNIVSGFAEVPVKIEHKDTALDGALGSLKSVWRNGKDLMGKVGFTKEAWALIDKAGARKLSVGVKRDKSGLTELSIVKTPRVATAAVFDDRIELDGVVEFGFGGLSASQIQDQARTILKPTKTLDGFGNVVSTGPWPYVMACYEDYLVIEMGSNSYKYPFEVKDGVVTLGTPVLVVQDWKEIPEGPAPMSQTQPETKGGDKMADNTQAATFSKEDVTKMIADATAGVEAKFSKLMDDKDATITALSAKDRERDAQTTIDRLKVAGKLTPAAEPFAKAILTAQDATVVEFSGESLSLATIFTRCIEALPKVVEFSEQGKAGAENDGEATFSTDEIAKAMRMFPGKTREEVMALMKKHASK